MKQAARHGSSLTSGVGVLRYALAPRPPYSPPSQ